MDAVSSVQCKLAVSAARMSYFFLVVIYQENGLCGLVWLHTKWILHGTHCNVFLIFKGLLEMVAPLLCLVDLIRLHF
jgi:hypothetical protein